MMGSGLRFSLNVLLACLLVVTLSVAANGENFHRQRIASDIGGVQGAAISPDGSNVALLKYNKLEIYDVSSLRLGASVELPVVPYPGPFVPSFTWSEPISRIRYCDHGRYILAYGGNGYFFVFDTQGYRKVSTITVDTPVGPRPTVIAGSCAAEANIVAVEVVTGAYESARSLKVFALDTAKLLGEISEGSAGPTVFAGVDVSPSASHALTYVACSNDNETCGGSQKIAVLDIRSFTVSDLIDAGFRIGQAGFVDESSIAVAGADFTNADARQVIEVFDTQTGVLKKQIGDSSSAPKAAVEASADGRFLFAYTGKENHCEQCGKYSRGHLIIQRSEFTVWDLMTGKVVAKSRVPALTENGRIPMFWGDPAGRTSVRPRFQFSQAGNAVLVTGTRDQYAVDVYLLK